MNVFKLDFRELYLAFENNEPRLCVYNNNRNKIRFLTSKRIKYLSDVEFVSPIVKILDENKKVKLCKRAP